MKKITDEELLEELRQRIQQNNDSLDELNRLNARLNVVNDKLEQSEGLKSHFLSNIRNEINNPLSSILGLSSNIMLIQNLDPEKIKATANLIHAEAFDLDFQLRNIFMAADIEAGEAEPHAYGVSIHQLVVNLINQFHHRINSKKLSVDYTSEIGEGSSQEFLFKTDSEKFQMIVSNLLSNAIKFSNPSSEINLSTRLSEGKLQFIIEDFGAGIDPEKQKLIFDRFEQLSTGTTKLYGGHGLGLSVTLALLDLLGGSIEVKSDIEQGSTFTVTVEEMEAGEDSEGFSDDGGEFFFDADETF